MPFYLLHREDLAGMGWELRTRARNEGVETQLTITTWFFVWLSDCALIIPSWQLSIQNPTNIRVTFHNYVPTCLYENGCLIQCCVDLVYHSVGNMIISMNFFILASPKACTYYIADAISSSRVCGEWSVTTCLEVSAGYGIADVTFRKSRLDGDTIDFPDTK